MLASPSNLAGCSWREGAEVWLLWRAGRGGSVALNYTGSVAFSDYQGLVLIG